MNEFEILNFKYDNRKKYAWVIMRYTYIPKERVMFYFNFRPRLELIEDILDIVTECVSLPRIT